MAQPERPTGFHATRSVPLPTETLDEFRYQSVTGPSETLDEFRYHEFGYLSIRYQSIRYQWN